MGNICAPHAENYRLANASRLWSVLPIVTPYPFGLIAVLSEPGNGNGMSAQTADPEAAVGPRLPLDMSHL